MKYKITLLILTFFCSWIDSISSQAEGLKLIYFNYQELQNIKNRIKSGDIKVKPAYDKLIQEANGLLSVAPEKVTEGDLPPSGDKHDFFAIGKLAFPNPKTPDGMPYVRRDGATNPEADGARYDLSRYNATLSRVNQLSLAWFFTGDERYAAKASQLLTVWFLDPETKMNPNLRNASALPGVYDGMPIGIIFSVALIKMVDHVKLLSLSQSWSTENDNSLKKWFDDYTSWLLESKMGKKEGEENSNHGTWYLAQVMAYSLYSGNATRAKPMIELAKKQIDKQITAAGSMPRELNRQRSLHYSIYGLQAFTIVAACADYLGEDLWHYKTADGRGIELAFSFLSPYLLGEKEWTWTNIEKGKLPDGALDIFHRAEQKFQIPEFVHTSQQLYKISPATSVDARLMIEENAPK